jgi:hypothetical protein
VSLEAIVLTNLGVTRAADAELVCFEERVAL